MESEKLLAKENAGWREPEHMAMEERLGRWWHEFIADSFPTILSFQKIPAEGGSIRNCCNGYISSYDQLHVVHVHCTMQSNPAYFEWNTQSISRARGEAGMISHPAYVHAGLAAPRDHNRLHTLSHTTLLLRAHKKQGSILLLLLNCLEGNCLKKEKTSFYVTSFDLKRLSRK